MITKDMNDYLKKISISSDTLKIIGCITMLIDHIGYGLLRFFIQQNQYIFTPDRLKQLNKLYEILRGIGRLSFPIFCFLLIEGFIHTKSILKYSIRLLVMALISEPLFDIAFFKSFYHPEHQNVLITLLIGLLTLWAIKYCLDIKGLSLLLKAILVLSVTAASMDIAIIAKCDYSYHGILAIVLLYLSREYFPINLLIGSAAFSWEKYAPISFLIMYFYDESQVPPKKYMVFFYLFYPVHLLLIFILQGAFGL